MNKKVKQSNSYFKKELLAQRELSNSYFKKELLAQRELIERDIRYILLGTAADVGSICEVVEKRLDIISTAFRMVEVANSPVKGVENVGDT